MKNKVAVAFSGGLDTSFCVTYLIKEKNLEVHSVFVDTGGFNEKQIKQIEERACSLGVVHHETVDVSTVYYEKCIRYLIFGNMLRNRSYPMSVSSERTFQALAVMEYAKKNDITILAHGSTGAGNDQVRFDMIFYILAPEMTILAPVRDLGISREDEKKYLEKSGANVTFPDYEYSINQGLWGTSVGGRETLTSHLGIPDNAYPGQLEIRDELNIEIEFRKGEIAGGIETIKNLQKIGH